MSRRPLLLAAFVCVFFSALPAFAWSCDPTHGAPNVRWMAQDGQLMVAADPISGAGSYDFYITTLTDYCAAKSGGYLNSLHLVYTNTSPLFSYPLAPNSVTIAALTAHGCPIPSLKIFWDTFPAAPAVPTGINTVPADHSVAFSLSYPDPHAGALIGTRTAPDGTSQQIVLNWDWYCPAGSPMTFTDYGTMTGPPGDLAQGRYTYTLCAVTSADSASCTFDGCTPAAGAPRSCAPPMTVVLGGGGSCEPPASVPVVSPVGGAPVAGQPLFLQWTPVAIDTAGYYAVESSYDASFAAPETPVYAFGGSGSLPTSPSADDRTLYVRVRARNGCSIFGPPSKVISVLLKGAPASVLPASGGVALSAVAGGTPPSAAVTLRNVGAAATRVFFATDAFFDVSPSALDLAAGATGSVTVTGRSTALASAGAFSGALVGTYGALTVRVPVTLIVTAASPGDRTGTQVRASSSTVTFTAPAGTNPAPQSITVTPVRVTGSGPVTLVPSVGPGGAWLVLPASIATPIPEGSSLTIPLSVDRARRSPEEGSAPLRTLLTLVPAGASTADATVVEVVDVETPAVQSGAGRSAPGGSSFIVPTTVFASGAGGAFYTSDGWLRNDASTPAALDLYYTPNDADGVSGSGVLQTSVTLAPRETRRLSNLVANFFATSGSGQLEVRAPGGALDALSLRTTTDAVTGGDPTSRYGTEIPAVAFGSGAARATGAVVIPKVDEDAAKRTNLILAETSGKAATATITLRDGGGAELGSFTQPVPAYGKEQVNRFATGVVPSLSGGSASVAVTAGDGSVVPVVTVIDNASNSFSAVLGRAPRQASASAPARQAAADSPALVIPSVVRLTGAFNTHFSTELALVNATEGPANLTLTYYYNDVDDGGKAKSITKPLPLSSHGGLLKSVGSDVISALFGVTNASYGWIKVTGSDAARVLAVSSVSAQVDPGDASKGFKTAQVDALYDDAPAVLVNGFVEARFSGAEKSVQRRSNLVLVEVAGEPVDIDVRAYAVKGEPLATRRVHVAANQYFQINDVFGDSGLALGAGPFQNVTIGAQVVGGAGKVVALLTVNDNISRNPEIFVLRPAGVPR